MLGVQQDARGDLAEIPQDLSAMVSVMEESMWSVGSALNLSYERTALSIERVATLMERQLQGQNEGFLGLCLDLQSLTQALTTGGHCQCGRRM